MQRTLVLTFLLISSIAVAQAKITINKTKFLPGEIIEVRYSLPGPAKPTAWIGIIPSGIAHGEESVNDANNIAYQYTPNATGTVTLEAPIVPGSYDLRWSGDGVEFASVSFEVSAVDYKASLKLKQDTFNPGDDIDLEFSVAAPLPKTAWIGLIPSDVPHGSEDVNDQHDLNYQYVEEKTSGTIRFAAP